MNTRLKHRLPRYTSRDAQFTAKVDAWQPLPRGFLKAFGPKGFAALNDRERTFCPDARTVVLLTFESGFAPLGGLAAVVRILPDSLKRAGEEVVVLTPLYVNIPKVKEALAAGVIAPVFPKQEFSCASYAGAVSCYRDVAASVPTYFIAVEGRFTAAQNPYSYRDSKEILDDSLVFCAAAPFVLKQLGIDSDVLFHAQDWETAPIAVTSKIAVQDGLLKNSRTVLTLHNSFDSGIDVGRRRTFFGGLILCDTVLSSVIPLLDGPLTTVSAPFADELRADPLQRTIFTNHLQGEFAANPPIGIENGMFGKPRLRYTYTALSHARQGVYDKLLAEKRRFREAMLGVVAAMAGRGEVIGGLAETSINKESAVGDEADSESADAAEGGVGRINTKERSNNKDIGAGRPIFFMSGRLDLMQKGFDAVFHAIRRFPAGGAGLIFCPSSADGARSSKELAFFKEVAAERPGDIVIWPFRITEEEYVAAVLGSSFLLMPSFYEPFGAATEGFIYGTPVVARATGGLTVQVKPLQRGASAVGSATGLLYREDAPDDSRACADWRAIMDLPIERRIEVPLYRSMVEEAFAALSEAASLFADGTRYGRMMVNCMDSLKSFSWDAAASKYRRIYETASRRGYFDD